MHSRRSWSVTCLLSLIKPSGKSSMFTTPLPPGNFQPSDPPLPLGISESLCGGVWIFSGTTQSSLVCSQALQCEGHGTRTKGRGGGGSERRACEHAIVLGTSPVRPRMGISHWLKYDSCHLSTFRILFVAQHGVC